ncbi:MAG: serpin family protein [Deltaproteobacteria bacterium]|nr:serpin family protein [Deltaproteobacteria bacterium]
MLIVLALAGCLLSPAPTPRAVTERTAELAPIVDGNNAFALDLYGWSADHGEGNLFLSPFSVTAALGMTRAGAAGDTAAAMDQVLHITQDPAVYHQQLGALTRDLSGDLNRGYTLFIANGLFGQTGLPFDADFLSIQAEDYGAPLQALDFQGDPDGARGEINRWVEDQTDGGVSELLPAGSVNDQTRIALANAVRFEAEWVSRFRSSETYDGGFVTPTGEVTVPLMRAEEVPCLLGERAGVQVLSLPYRGDEVSLIALLPGGGYSDEEPAIPDLFALEAALDLPTLDGWLGSLSPTETTVVMPRFTISYTLPLTQALTDLGMGVAFSASADLTAMGPPDLFLQDAFHQATVQVDEAGTEATGSTAVLGGQKGDVEGFYATRPFLFLIRDNLTGTILFVGRVVDPS